MDNPTIYRLLEARDSADAAELMRRNGFFFGKLDPQLSAERYDLLQKLKGYLFGVGAEISGKLAAIICVYRAGADRSANSHQVFASALLVDAAYRTRLYSFTEMYRLMLRHLRESMPQVREILLEVYRENLPSLYMQRMFGSVLLDETMPNPEELFIHNYAPAIQRFFLPMWQITGQKMEAALVPFDKKKVRDTTPLTDGRYVSIRHIVNGVRMDVYCNIHSACVCRIHSENSFYAGLEPGGLLLRNESEALQQWTIYPEKTGNAEAIRVAVEPGIQTHVSVPETMTELILCLDGTPLHVSLYTDEDWERDYCNPEPADVPGKGPVALMPRTGLLVFAHEPGVRFQELWPYLTSPYLFGTVVPDPERVLSEGRSGDLRQLTEERRGFRMRRSYDLHPTGARIHTECELAGGAASEFDPVFALHLQDMEGSCRFCSKSGRITQKTFDYVRDFAVAHDEVILYEFREEAYAGEELGQILLNFNGASYRVTADRPFRAYLHCNYIFIRPIPYENHPDGWKWTDGKADLGTIQIDKED